MAYRLARALAVFRDEVNARWPGRDKASDGWIGDPAHASRRSDHNPWVKDPARVGVVRAYDIDSGPGGNTEVGLWLAEHVRALGRAGHPALGNGSYVISARRIASAKSGWAWRSYTGTNPHVSHTHVSVSLDQGGYDTQHGWSIAGGAPSPPPAPPAPAHPMIRRGSRGDAVKLIQRFLGIPDDGIFGPATERKVKDYQRMRGLAADGIVGPRTWAATGL